MELDMDDSDAQNKSVDEVRTSEPVLRIAPPKDQTSALSFAEHHDMLDRLIEDCRTWLRNTTAYHGCEAQVEATWSGQAVLVRHEMTNAVRPDGSPLVITARCELPVPWMSGAPLDYVTIMRQGLAACDQAIERNKVQYKCLRISFAAFARTMSLTLAKPLVKENGRQTAIVAP